MYIYFDSNGVIKEIVNDVAIRKGSADYNKLYVYIEGNPEIDDIWYFQKFPNGSTSNEVSFVDDVVIKSIPYDAKRDMKYFKDFVQYKFYVFTLTSEYLNISGLAIGTIRIAVDNSIFALGELTFNIQANEVNADNNITQSQYDYLLLAYASRTLSEQTGSDLDALLDEKIEAKATDIIEPIFDDYKSTIDDEVEAQNETIASLIQASPSVFDTAANIQLLQENKGVAVATDTGYIWYWDTTITPNAYVSSGLQYNSLANYTKHSGNQLQDANGNNIYPNVNYGSLDSELKGILYKSTNNSSNVITYKLLMSDGTLTNSNEATAVVTNEIMVNEGDRITYTGAWYVNARAGVIGYKQDGTVVELVGSTDYPSKQLSNPVTVLIPSGVIKIRCASNNITNFPLTATLIQENVEKKKITFTTSSSLLPIGVGLSNKTVVVTKGANEAKIESPNVFWDPILTRYGMVYTSYGSDGNGGVTYGVIKYAYSYDLKNWVNNDTTILTPNSTPSLADSGSVTAPVVYIENGTYYLFYCGCTDAGYEQGTKTICLATGTDLTNLTRYANNPIIQKKAGETWYNTDCYHANVNKVGDTYYLFFNALGWAYGYNEHKAESIGYAISKDLYTWVVSDNACLKYSTNNADYDYSIVGDPYLFDIGDNYIYMAYFTYSHPNPQGMHDYLAKCLKTDFPNNWVKTNIKLTTSSFDAKPSIIFRGGKIYHFYGASGNNIGYYTE